MIVRLLRSASFDPWRAMISGFDSQSSCKQCLMLSLLETIMACRSQIPDWTWLTCSYQRLKDHSKFSHRAKASSNPTNITTIVLVLAQTIVLSSPELTQLDMSRQPAPPPGGSRKISFNVSDQYDIQDVVGEGAYGVVWYISRS